MVGSKDLRPDPHSFGYHFFNNQFRAKPRWPDSDTDLTGKTAIITGSNTGLGYESARQLLELKLGCLIMGVRSLKRGEASAAKLRENAPKSKIQVWSLDMASYESIQAFSQRVNNELAHVDFILLNAGLFNAKFNIIPATGHEEVLQVNYLSTVLLASLLMPILQQKRSLSGEPSRITIVNAALALIGAYPEQQEGIDIWKSLDDPNANDFQARYNVSKMLAHMWLWKVVDHVTADDVIVNLADCAWVKNTNLGNDASLPLRVVAKVAAGLVGRTVPVGASCFTDALLNHGKESHGGFFMSWTMHPFHSFLYTEQGGRAIEDVWTQTLREFSRAKVAGLPAYCA